MRGDHDGGGVRLVLLGQAENIQPGRFGFHDQVRDHHIECAMTKLIHRLRRRVHHGADVAGSAQRINHGFGVLDVVVYQEDLGWFHAQILRF